jgi:hypothetical protein
LPLAARPTAAPGSAPGPVIAIKPTALVASSTITEAAQPAFAAFAAQPAFPADSTRPTAIRDPEPPVVRRGPAAPKVLAVSLDPAPLAGPQTVLTRAVLTRAVLTRAGAPAPGRWRDRRSGRGGGRTGTAAPGPDRIRRTAGGRPCPTRGRLSHLVPRLR